MRPVGILGGMGPEATIDLMRRVLAAVPASDDADHVPLIVHQNPQVPSRIAHLIDGTGEDTGPTLAAMARGLAGAGAQALAMPCNTAHHYAQVIREATNLPFLDMVALSVAAAQAAATGQGRADVAILCSPATRIAGVFDPSCRAAGLTPHYAADDAAMLAAIRAIKTRRNMDQAPATLHAASKAITTPVQIIACTEYSLIADALSPDVLAIDTLDVLTQAIVAFASGASDG